MNHPDTVQSAIAEMRRKPDAHLALELIDQLTADENVLAIIGAYLDALDEQ